MTLLLSEKDIHALMDMSALIDALISAQVQFSRGNASPPMRYSIKLPRYPGSTDMMPGYLAESNVLAVKVLSSRWNNTAAGLPIIHAAVLLIDPGSGRLMAIMDGGSLTAYRTAAVSGVATRYLSREQASSLAIIGTGRQAGTHLWAMTLVRSVERVVLFDRNMEKAADFKNRMEKKFQCDFELAASAESAVKTADIVVLSTTANEPVLFGQWLREGMHINSIASATPRIRELDSAAIQKSKVVVDSREAALKEAGDLLIPLSEGKIAPGHIYAEIGEIAGGIKPGRVHESEITVYKSLGLAIQDAAAAEWLYQRAVQEGFGTEADL